MKAKLIGYLISLILRQLTPELLKSMADRILDFVEDKVMGSASTVDDAIVLPICGMIRNTFDIPDDDDSIVPGS